MKFYRKLLPFLFENPSPITETEEYYQKSFGISGKLNPVKAREFYSIYQNAFAGKQVLYYYDPEGITPQAAEESGFPKDRGTLVYTSQFLSNTLVFVLPGEKKLLIPHKRFLFDPRLQIQFESLVSIFPEFSDFTVYTMYDEDILGTLGSLVRETETVSGNFPRHVSRYEHQRMESEKENPTGESFEPTFREFRFKVLKDISTIPWYHATRRSNLRAIKRAGLIPSKDFQQVQSRGWTMLNFELQNAVYLTMDLEHAKDIARTLASRYDESAVVLEINGSVLKDRTHIVIDEDALRNDFDGNITVSTPKGMPDYLSSVTHSIESIGFSKTISPGFIKFKWSTNQENDDS